MTSNHHLCKFNCSSYEVDRVVDTTGAGDAFVAGFLLQWISFADIMKALDAGCLCGAAAVTQLGGSEAKLETIKEIEDYGPNKTRLSFCPGINAVL